MVWHSSRSAFSIWPAGSWWPSHCCVAVAAYGQSYLGAYLAQHLAYRLRNLLYEQIQRLSFAYHDRMQTGELMSRATADIEAIRLFFHFGLPTASVWC